MTGGLASPPESHSNSPLVPIGASSKQDCSKIAPLFVNPKDLQNSLYSSRNDVERCKRDNLAEHEDNDVESESTPSSRRSSLLLSSSGILEHEIEGESMTAVISDKPLSDSSQVEDEIVDGMAGVESMNLMSRSRESSLLSSLGDASEIQDESNNVNAEVSEKPLLDSAQDEESVDSSEVVNPMTGVELDDPLSDSMEIVVDLLVAKSKTWASG